MTSYINELKTNGLLLNSGVRLGKYKLKKQLGKGGSCEVWQAWDSVEGIEVALKIPLTDTHGNRDNQAFLKEIRAVAQLRHPNILPVKNADIISGYVVLSTELSMKTLADCSKPMSFKRIAILISQVLEGLAYAHKNQIVHCDVSPNNIFLFQDNKAKLGDFGISVKKLKGRPKTIDEFGTPGYVAPEQAYGYPVYSSDTFAIGLILYEYITGVLPKWPFEWPFRGHERLKQKTSKSFVDFIRKSTYVNPRSRFANGEKMLTAMIEALPDKIISDPSKAVPKQTGWRKVRREAFEKKYKKILPDMHKCVECNEPISERMQICPWCGSSKNRFDSNTRFTHICPDCHKGILPEWRFCPWCFGAGFEPGKPDPSFKVHYHSQCNHCGGNLIRFMKYCPWCRRKIKNSWYMHQFPEICNRCSWPVDTEFWNYCPWCKLNLTV